MILCRIIYHAPLNSKSTFEELEKNLKDGKAQSRRNHVFNHTVLDAIDSQSCSLILSRNNKMKIIKVMSMIKNTNFKRIL